VLSIGKVRPGGEDYYLREVTGPEDYYLGAGETPGRWIGSASGELGLSGEVGREDLTAGLAARSPIDGSSLTGRKVSPDRHVPAFDVTFSAPKSVSLLYGLAPQEVSEAVKASHDEAVQDALSYLEAHAAFTRRGRDGLHRIKTSGFVAAAFRQRTSRNGDPQLHTHLLT
jgi:conjugative relaxase-like TrwC/TraI family protein